MIRLGYMSRFCCLPLAGASILGACLFYTFMALSIAANSDDYLYLNAIINGIVGTSLVLGLIFKKFYFFYVSVITMMVELTSCIINFAYYIYKIIFTSNVEKNGILWNIIFYVVCFSVIISMMNVFLSMCYITKVGGSGWEYKNFEQVENALREKAAALNKKLHNEYKV